MLAVLAGLFVALIFFIVLFDWNWLKRPIEALVEDQLGREIEIAGELDAELSLTPRIVAHDVRLANADWGTEPDMLHADRLSFVLDLRQLVGGRLDVRDIAIEGADVLVERGADGEVNWQLAREEDEEALTPIVGQFEIDDALIRYRDPGLERELQLALESAQGTGGQATEPLQMAGQGAFAGLPLRLDLQAGSLDRLQAGDEPYPIDLELVAGDNTLSVAGAISTPQELQAAELDLQLVGPDLTPILVALEVTEERAPPIATSGQVVHEGEVWALMDLDLAVGGSTLTGDVGVDFSGEPPLLRAQLASDGLTVQELTRFFETVLPAEQEGPPLFTDQGLDPDALPHLRADVELEARDVEVAPDLVLDRLRLDARLVDQIPWLALAGDGRLRGDPVTVDLDLGGEPPPGGTYPVRGMIAVGESRLALDGQTAQPLDLTSLRLDVDLLSPEPSALLALLGLPAPELPEMELTGRLTREGDRLELADFSARARESDLSGTLSARLTEPRPRIEANLTSTYMQYNDIEPFVDAVRDLTGDAPEVDLLTTENGRPRLQLEALPNIDTDLTLRAERLEAPEVDLQDVQARLRLGEHLPMLSLVAEGTVFGEQTEIDLALGTGEAVDGPPDAYPLEARIAAEQSRLELSGWLERPIELEGINMEFDLASPMPARWLELAGLPAPELPPIEAAGRLIEDGRTWQLADASLRSGQSDLTGALQVSVESARPSLQADLASTLLDHDDIAPFVAWMREIIPQGPGSEIFTVVDGRPQLRPDALPEVDAEVTYRAERLEAPDLDLQDVQAQLRLVEDRLPVLTLVAEGTVLGEATEIDLALGTSEVDDAARYPVQARIAAEETRLELSGHIEHPTQLEGLDLQFEIASPNPTQWLALAGFAAPELPTIRAAGHLIQDEQSWRVPDLYLEVAENNLFGEAAVDLGRPRPFIRADLQSNRLVVGKLRQLVPDQTDGEPRQLVPDQTDGEPRNGPGGVAGAALPAADLDLALEAEHLRWEDLRLEPLTAQVRLREGVLVLDLSGEGWFHDSPITVEAQLGADEVLEDTGASYPVEIALRTPQTEVTAQGRVGEPLDFTELAVEISVQGESLEELGGIFQLGLPATAPYRLSGSVQHEDGRWTLAGLDGRIGRSDLGGEVRLDTSGERPVVTADLRSDRLDFADLGGAVGEPPGPETAIEEPGLLPEEEVALPDLTAVDLDLRYAARNVVARQIPVDQVQIEARIEDGVLRVAPLGFELGVGVFTGELHLDTREELAQASADLRLHGADAEYIFDVLEIELPGAEPPLAVGRLDARAELAAHGTSLDDLAATVNGQLAGITEGGWVTAVLGERLGMNLLEIIGLVVPDPEEMEAVRCFVASFDVDGGLMTIEALVLDTVDTLITGSGAIDFAEERVDVALQAQSKEAEFPVLAPTPVYFRGPFGEVEEGPDPGEVAERFLAALGLGVALPVVGAAIPFIEPGLEEDSDCAWLIEQVAQADAPAEAPAVD